VRLIERDYVNDDAVGLYRPMDFAQKAQFFTGTLDVI